MQLSSEISPAAPAQWQHLQTRIDGARVHYIEAGQGEPVLLLHGYPQSSTCWRHQIAALAARYRVIAPDWPGFGRSEPCADPPPSYETEVARIGQFSEQLGLRQFNLIAHDYGGFIGLGYVLQNPDRVLRLALLNSRAHGTFKPWFYRFSLRQHWIATHAPARALARALPLGGLHRRGFRRYRSLGCFTRSIENEYLGWMDTPAGRRWYFEFFAHYHVPIRPELAAGLASIRCPTAVIWGERDSYIPLATAHELAERIPGATLTSFPDADHFIMEERPAEVTAALANLLAREALTHAARWDGCAAPQSEPGGRTRRC